MIISRLITGKRTHRGTFLQQNITEEEVPSVYFKTPLYGTNEGVAVVDIVGKKVLYYLNRRRKKGKEWSGGSLDYNVSGNSPMIRWSTIHKNKKGLTGWTDCRGRFHKFKKC